MSKIIQSLVVGGGAIGALYYGQVRGTECVAPCSNVRFANGLRAGYPFGQRMPPTNCKASVATRSVMIHSQPSSNAIPLSLQVGWQVYQSSSEERRIQGRRDAEIAAAVACQTTMQREEQRATVLQEQLATHQSAVASLDGELDELRQRVGQLEQERSSRQTEALEAAAMIEKCRQHMVEAAAELKRRKENAVVRGVLYAAVRACHDVKDCCFTVSCVGCTQVAEQALMAAHSHAQETKLLYNPLNHPMVKSFMSK
jgi:hypothetical protein